MITIGTSDICAETAIARQSVECMVVKRAKYIGSVKDPALEIIDAYNNSM
jgi:hypothetical protein